MGPLKNPKHEIFAQEFAAGKTATAAMITAGYSEKWARQNSTRLVTTNDDLRSRIAELQELLLKDKLVDARKLHTRWSEMFDADIADIVEADTATNRMRLKPLHQWPKVWRQMLSGAEVKELFEHSKDGGDASWDKIGELVKMKFVDQLKLGELIGRHKAVDAFVAQKAQVDVTINLAEEISRTLTEGRQRLRLQANKTA